MNQLHYHKGKKSDLGFYDHVSWRILEKYKHLQQKVDQWLVFAAMRQKISPFCLSIVNEKYIPAKNCLFSLQYEISSLRPAIIYENFMFTQKYAFTERCCFLTLSFEASSENMIFPWQKHTGTNKNMIFSTVFTNFRKTKILFFKLCCRTKVFITFLLLQ